MLTNENLEFLAKNGTPADLALLQKYLFDPYLTWSPRPDQPALLDEQASFVFDAFDGMAVAVGGNGSGKSDAGAYKLTRLVSHMPPPKDLAKFFIVSETLEQAGTLWAEKLQFFIPAERVQSIEWNSQSRRLPMNIILKAQAGHGGKRWQLLFRSFEQGRRSFAGHSNVVGFWIDEPCPLAIVDELWARCRENKIPGAKFWTLTPIDMPIPPIGQDSLEDVYNQPAKYPFWKFYRLNTECNDTLGDLSFLANIPEDMRETRRTGAFCHLTGGIFKEFEPSRHVVPPQELPPNCDHFRVIDWGFEHETACLWVAREKTGRYWVYHEWGASEKLIHEKVEAIRNAVPQFRGATYADPADLQQRSEFANLGLPSTVARKEPVNQSIEQTRKQMLIAPDGRPNLLIFNTCPRLINQIRNYRWQGVSESKINPKPTPEKPVKRNDDFVDCLRMGVFSTQHVIKPWAVGPARR